VLGWLEAPDASLSDLCQMAAVRGVTISPQGLAQRFTQPLATALEQVLATLVADVVCGPPVAIPLLRRFRHVWVLDTTTITLPAALADTWAGCGGQAGQGQAALKVALELDLLTGQLRGPLLQPGRVPDRATPLCSAAPAADTLIIRDLGFFTLDGFATTQAADGYWLSRLMAGTVVYTADGQRWTQPDLLGAQTADVVDLAVSVGATARLPARLLAARVPTAVAEARRVRLRREAKKKGQPVSAERLALADWTVLVTNLSLARLTHAEARALLRARWQIEQLFDLWKTDGGLDRCASGQPWRILCEVYAKLIALVIAHWMVLHGDWQAPNHSLGKALRVVRAHSRLLALAFDRPRRLAAALRTLGRLLQHAGRLNTRRRHPNTYQRLLDPPEIGLT
jgi:Transposase DDE domain